MWPCEQGGELLSAVLMSSRPCARNRGVQILWQESTAPCFLLCHWVFKILFVLSTHSQLLSHGFLGLFLVRVEMLLQEHTGSNALLLDLLPMALFPYLHPPSHPFSLSPFPHYCGKGRKGKETLQK